jgi:protein-L-isoaspartate(D-aspartate) O-methyltransferase
MLTPLQEASILQHLMLDGSERVLEIGTGTGFLTAMLAMQAKEIISCEIHSALAEQAIENLEAHGISNAKVIQINAMDADAMAAQADMAEAFDAIVLTAAVKEIPAHLESLLKDGGQIMAFVGQNPVVSLIHKYKVGHVWQESSIFETLLLDMEGLTEKREFVF